MVIWSSWGHSALHHHETSNGVLNSFSVSLISQQPNYLEESFSFPAILLYHLSVFHRFSLLEPHTWFQVCLFLDKNPTFVSLLLFSSSSIPKLSV